MKSLVIFCCLIILGNQAFSQIRKSLWMLNGDIGYQNLKEEGADEAVGLLTFNPKIGYLATNSLMIGADIDVLSISSGGSNFTQSLLGPFVRVYSKSSDEDAVIFFGEASYSFGSDKSDSSKDKVSAWSFGAGFSAFLGERVALEPAIRYQSSKTKLDTTPEMEYKVGVIEVLIGLSVYLGGTEE
jgi:hypothetical protein